MKKPGMSEESSLPPSLLPGDPPSATPVRVLLIEDNEVRPAGVGMGPGAAEEVKRLHAIGHPA